MREFDRVELKNNAKASINLANTKPAVATLIKYSLVILSIFMIFGFDLDGVIYYFTQQIEENKSTISYEVLGVAVGLFIQVIAFGYTSYCLLISRNENTVYTEIFNGFSTMRRFFKILFVAALQAIYKILWTLIFAIPYAYLLVLLGPMNFYFALFLSFPLYIPLIIKSISYSQTYFILLDDFTISANDAITMSKHYMNGKKLEYFKLLLSFFIGYLLCVFSLGIALFWIDPYLTVTLANFYNSLINWGAKTELTEDFKIEENLDDTESIDNTESIDKFSNLEYTL